VTPGILDTNIPITTRSIIPTLLDIYQSKNADLAMAAAGQRGNSQAILIQEVGKTLTNQETLIMMLREKIVVVNHSPILE